MSEDFHGFGQIHNSDINDFLLHMAKCGKVIKGTI